MKAGILAGLALAVASSVVPAAADVTNGGFESSFTGWTTQGTYGIGSTAPHGGSKYAVLASASANSATAKISQSFNAPADDVQFTFWYKVDSTDDPGYVYDMLDAYLVDNTADKVVAFAPRISNFERDVYSNTWRKATCTASGVSGHNLAVLFYAITDEQLPTRFLIDDVSVVAYSPGSFSGAQPSQQQGVAVWANSDQYFVVSVNATNSDTAVSPLTGDSETVPLTVPPGDVVVSLVYDYTLGRYTSYYISGAQGM